MRNIWIIFTVLLSFFFTGCGNSIGEVGTVLFDKTENLPALITEADGEYSIMSSIYGSDVYSLNNGPLEELKNIYSTEKVYIWYLQSNTQYSVWTERDDKTISFKYYDKKSGSVNTIETVEFNDRELQSMQLGVYKSGVYYVKVDYNDNSASVIKYDIEKKSFQKIVTYRDVDSYGVLEVSGNDAVVAFNSSSGCSVINIDLDNNKQGLVSLPKNVKSIFSVSYDETTKNYALYYSEKNGSENIGIMKADDSDIKPIYTFSSNEYAYRDNIELDKGHLFWVTQSNVSGDIEDHYKLVDYCVEDDSAIEYAHSFGWCTSENMLTILSFKGGIKKIEVKSFKR